jgi:LysM repeat protein
VRPLTLFVLALALCGSQQVFGQAKDAEKAGPAKEPAAQSTELKTGPVTIAPHWSKYTFPTSIAEGETYYIIEKGDTLWDISKKFLNSPYLWPQIWDQNKYIRDAHWIYPGDPIVLPKLALVAQQAGQAVGTEGIVPVGDIANQVEAESGVAGATSRMYPMLTEQARLCAGRVIEDGDDQKLKVIGSEQGQDKVAFSERDILYINQGSADGIHTGDVFTTQRSAYKVKHPEGGVVGTKIEMTGLVRVILTQDHSSTVVVEKICADILKNDYLKNYTKASIPLLSPQPQADRLSPSSGKSRGYIVDLEGNVLAVADGHIVTVDVGAQDGLSAGQRLIVYRMVYPGVAASRNVVGEVAVFDVRERISTAVVLRSNDGIRNGDYVELK